MIDHKGGGICPRGEARLGTVSVAAASPTRSLVMASNSALSSSSALCPRTRSAVDRFSCSLRGRARTGSASSPALLME